MDIATIFRKANGLPDDVCSLCSRTIAGASGLLSHVTDWLISRTAGLLRSWRAQRRSVFHCGGQGGQSLAFREQGPLAHAGWAFGRKFPLVGTWGVTNKLRL